MAVDGSDSMAGARASAPAVGWLRRLPLFCKAIGPEDGDPILFLHGITGSHRYWVRKAAPLAERYRLILPDLPGFGHSAKPDVHYTPEVFLEGLRGLLTRLGLERGPLSIVGHSLGSIIAAEYAARYPEGIEKLVLMNLPRFRDTQHAHRIWWLGSPSYRQLLRQQSLRENLAQARRTGWWLTVRSFWSMPWEVVADCRKFTFRSLTSTIEHCLLNYRVDPVLPGLARFPVLMIHGRHDQVAPYEQIRMLPEEYPNIRLVTLPRSGHHVFLTDTRRVCRLIVEFVENGADRNAASGFST
jgi:pimeloyl-ACP methyl ester carboxylesterase